MTKFSEYAALTAVCLALSCGTLACLNEPAEPHREGGVNPPVHSLYRALDSTGSPDAKLSARLMRPKNPSRPLPLVVFLHGAGERGNDNLLQLSGVPELLASTPWARRFPCYVLAPQIPLQTSWNAHLEELEALIQHSISTNSIDPDRVYLIGFSMGGGGAWSMAARRPDMFAAVMPLATGGNPQNVSPLINTPLWAVHGADDTAMPVNRSKRMIEALTAAGGSPRYTVLPGVGHGCWIDVFSPQAEYVPWLFRQRRARSAGDRR